MEDDGLRVLDHDQLAAVHRHVEARLERYPGAGLWGTRTASLGDPFAVEHDVDLVATSFALAGRHGLNNGDDVFDYLRIQSMAFPRYGWQQDLFGDASRAAVDANPRLIKLALQVQGALHLMDAILTLTRLPQQHDF
jgi:hypothetical protein